MQAVLFGYPGIRVRADGMLFSPELFENVAVVNLVGIGFMGSTVDVTYDATIIKFSLQVLAAGSKSVVYRLSMLAPVV